MFRVSELEILKDGFLINPENMFAAIDEASLCMSYVIPIAFRYALNSARVEAGKKEEWYQLGKFYSEI